MRITDKPLDQVVMTKRHVEQQILQLLLNWQNESGLFVTGLSAKINDISGSETNNVIQDVKIQVTLP